jgi:Cu(I)/Ag(I) efflux system periplasmic protein CusF
MNRTKQVCMALLTVPVVLTASAQFPAAAASATDRIVVAQAEKPSGQGVVNSVDAASRKINMTHGPVAALKWPGMTMDFAVAQGVDLGALAPGAKVSFTLVRGADGQYSIDSISRE